MLFTTLWPMTLAHAQDGLPIDYQQPTPRANLTDEMYPNSIDGWNGISSGAAEAYWESSTSNKSAPDQRSGEFSHEAVPVQEMMTAWQVGHWAGENIAATLFGSVLIFGALAYLATRLVKDMTLEIIMKAQVPGVGFSLAVAKYLHAMDPGAFAIAEKAAYLKQQEAMREARGVTDVAEASRTAELTKFLSGAEAKISNTYLGPTLKALSLIETGLTLAEFAKSGVLSFEQKALIKPVLASLIASVREVATVRRTAAYQPISVTLPLVQKPKMDELEAADALEEFAAELAKI